MLELVNFSPRDSDSDSRHKSLDSDSDSDSKPAGLGLGLESYASGLGLGLETCGLGLDSDSRKRGLVASLLDIYHWPRNQCSSSQMNSFLLSLTETDWPGVQSHIGTLLSSRNRPLMFEFYYKVTREGHSFLTPSTSLTQSTLETTKNSLL